VWRNGTRVLNDVAGLLDALDIHRTHLLGSSMGSMIGMEFALRHADRLDRLVLAGPGAAPARSAFNPISIWNWVKAQDPSGEVFGGQKLTWLFSSAFLRNQEAVQGTIALLASNPNPVEPETYNRQRIGHPKRLWWAVSDASPPASLGSPSRRLVAITGRCNGRTSVDLSGGPLLT